MKKILILLMVIFLSQTIQSQTVVYNWNGNEFGANGLQARRMTIGRIYYNQNHWGSYGSMVLKIKSYQFKSGYVEYLLMANPAVNGNNMPVLYCLSSAGQTAKYVKLELGSESSAGSTYEGGNNLYRDVYLDADYYTSWFLEATVTGSFELNKTTISSSEYSRMTLFSTPPVNNISNFYPHQKIIQLPSENADFFLDGKVGIGTANPTDKLHVSGDNARIKLSGASYTSVEIMDGGTGDPGYIKTYYNGAVDNQIGVNGTYFALQFGNVGIGTSSPSEKLSVNGNIRTKKLIVSQSGWPDYVFDSSYSLRSLSEVEKFITINKRLPDMPSSKEVEEKGISVGDNQALLLKKIEELTLYIIKMNKENNEAHKRIELLEKKLGQLGENQKK